MPPADPYEPLRAGRWFAALPASMQGALLNEARILTLGCGTLLFRRDDPSDGLYGVIDGAIRFSVLHAGGKETVIGLAEPPQWFGEVALLDDGRRTHDAWADTATVLAHVPLGVITGWLARHPAHWKHIGELATHKLRVALALLEDSRLYPTRVRLARCLLTLIDGYGQRDPSGPLRLHVSQERLGTLLAMSRQTVNALLQDLERQQLLRCVRGGLIVLDERQLRRLGAVSVRTR